MVFSVNDRQRAIKDSIYNMDEKHLRWLVNVLLQDSTDQEMSKPLESIQAFLNQTDADFMFQEAVMDAKKAIDAFYFPYSSYYKDRLVELVMDASRDAGIPEEGIIFKTLSVELETAFLHFWEGNASSETIDNKKRFLLNVLKQIVSKVIHKLGVDYFSQIQQRILSSILNVSALEKLVFS